MSWPTAYSALNRNVYSFGEYRIAPIHEENSMDIMLWRNEQMFHLRQSAPLTEEAQRAYFTNVVKSLFESDKPNQILFGFYHQDVFVGYGGLVHINYIDQHAEISFLMKTALQEVHFEAYWTAFLNLIIKPAFLELKLRKVFTYAFDVRPQLYPALESAGFREDARLKDHCLVNGEYRDVLIHSYWNPHIKLTTRLATQADCDTIFEWANDPLARQFALNPQPIPYENHVKWYTGKMVSEDCILTIFESAGIPAGMVRLDKSEDSWIISYSVAPVFRGLGLGLVFIERILSEYPQLTYTAIVRQANTASQKVFESLNFAHGFNSNMVEGENCHVYTWNK